MRLDVLVRLVAGLHVKSIAYASDLLFANSGWSLNPAPYAECPYCDDTTHIGGPCEKCGRDTSIFLAMDGGYYGPEFGFLPLPKGCAVDDAYFESKDASKERKETWYISTEFSIMGPGFLGGFLHPKMRWDPENLTHELEEEILAKTSAMIRETFNAARMLHAIHDPKPVEHLGRGDFVN